MNFYELLKDTQYEEKAKCIERAFHRAGVTDHKTLQNAPVIIRGPVCGEDIYAVVSVVNFMHENREELMMEEEE